MTSLRFLRISCHDVGGVPEHWRPITIKQLHTQLKLVYAFTTAVRINIERVELEVSSQADRLSRLLT